MTFDHGSAGGGGFFLLWSRSPGADTIYRPSTVAEAEGGLENYQYQNPRFHIYIYIYKHVFVYTYVCIYVYVSVFLFLFRADR